MRLPFPAVLPPLLAALLLGACATRPPASDPEALAEYRENNDPAEPFNRAMYRVNGVVDRNVLRPVAVGYREVVPSPVRAGVRNFLGNLRTPVVLVNDILQGQPQRAGDTLGRFLVNTTVGLGGIIDVARDNLGVPGHSEDFGQTLATFGVGEGPYLFLPILGPSNARDLAGFAAQFAVDPLTYVTGGVATGVSLGRGALTIVDTRESVIETLDQVDRSSLDPYATIRSAYRQRRATDIGNRQESRDSPSLGSTGFQVGTTPAPRN